MNIIWQYACEELWITALSFKAYVLNIFKNISHWKFFLDILVLIPDLENVQSPRFFKMHEVYLYIYTLFDLTCYLLIDLQHQLITIIINPEFVEALFTP